jgi:hypothetical protein
MKERTQRGRAERELGSPAVDRSVLRQDMWLERPQPAELQATVVLQTVALNGTGGTSFSNNFKHLDLTGGVPAGVRDLAKVTTPLGWPNCHAGSPIGLFHDYPI